MPKHLVRNQRNVVSSASRSNTEPTTTPALTRDEYHRLLTTAKAKNDERTYLLIKLFALTGLNVQELPQITVEAAKAGYLTVTTYNTKHPLRVPSALAQDLQSYAARQNILEGPIFLQRTGAPLQRFTATALIRSLAEPAHVDAEKCNPRALRCLFQSLKTEAEAKFQPMVEETLRRQLEEEQMALGWDS